MTVEMYRSGAARNHMRKKQNKTVHSRACSVEVITVRRFLVDSNKLHHVQRPRQGFEKKNEKTGETEAQNLAKESGRR